MTVNVVTRPYCPYCSQAIKLLKEKGVDFEQIEIETKEEQAAWKERSGFQTFPQIWANSVHVGGYDDLKKSIESGAFDALLSSGRTG